MFGSAGASHGRWYEKTLELELELPAAERELELPATEPGLERFSLEGVTYQQQLVTCGKPTCAKRHGPYWYAFWWSNGKTRSKYVGKRLPTEISARR